MINWLLIKYENTIIKYYRYAQEQNIYSFYELLTDAY